MLPRVMGGGGSERGSRGVASEHAREGTGRQRWVRTRHTHRCLPVPSAVLPRRTPRRAQGGGGGGGEGGREGGRGRGTYEKAYKVVGLSKRGEAAR